MTVCRFLWSCLKWTRRCTKRYSYKNRLLRLVVAILGFVLFGYVYYELNLINYAWYTRPVSSEKCRRTHKEVTELAEISRDIHYVLQQLNITHWLAYGSLWGAIRNHGPLPWDNDVDIGVLQEDINRIRGKFYYKLASKRLSLEYQHWGGFYRVTRGNTRADLMVFDENNNGYMERVGIESYVFFVNYKMMHVFPSELLRKPLPTMKFAGVDMPVPQRGIEVQKYHYPYDWWKESKPVGC